MTAGCDQIQGYLAGRPFPIERYAELVNGPPPASERHSDLPLEQSGRRIAAHG
ncbi:MAG: hypothetical protein NTU64_02935 [Hyphomicrobiales bacterium]|nr:hypothetical protein [Hyphomicrobiales bacterium]